MKGKDILICGLAVLAGGALVGVSVGAFANSKDEKADVSDTTTENLDLVDLIGDLQDEVYSLKADNTALQNQLDTLKNDNLGLQNQLNNVITDNNALQSDLNNVITDNTALQSQVDSLFDSDVTVNGDLYSNNVVASNGDFDSITIGDTEFTESDLDKHLYEFEIQLGVNLFLSGSTANSNEYSLFSFKIYVAKSPIEIFPTPPYAFGGDFAKIYDLTGKNVFNTYESGPSDFLVEAIRIKSSTRFDILTENGEWIEISTDLESDGPNDYLYSLDILSSKKIF